ncbi:MAG TPA: hypothetical protein VFE36_08510 [Candidatus Baltobacteraceae bacterium]|nr:hypothetical protein [Candidatus Baltobacteraceae bacterium]
MLRRIGAIDRCNDCRGSLCVEPLESVNRDASLEAVALGKPVGYVRAGSSVEQPKRSGLGKKIAERARLTVSGRRDDERQRGGSSGGDQRDDARTLHAIVSTGAPYSSGPS